MSIGGMLTAINVARDGILTLLFLWTKLMSIIVLMVMIVVIFSQPRRVINRHVLDAFVCLSRWIRLMRAQVFLPIPRYLTISNIWSCVVRLGYVSLTLMASRMNAFLVGLESTISNHITLWRTVHVPQGDEKLNKYPVRGYGYTIRFIASRLAGLRTKMSEGNFFFVCYFILVCVGLMVLTVMAIMVGNFYAFVIFGFLILALVFDEVLAPVTYRFYFLEVSANVDVSANEVRLYALASTPNQKSRASIIDSKMLYDLHMASNGARVFDSSPTTIAALEDRFLRLIKQVRSGDVDDLVSEVDKERVKTWRTSYISAIARKATACALRSPGDVELWYAQALSDVRMSAF